MNKTEYRARLESSWWKSLASELKDFVHQKCQICGCSNPDSGLHVHHLSYNHLGGPKEHEDLVVVCGKCHETYHSTHTAPPKTRSSRQEMLSHFADAVGNKGVDTHYFLKNGESDVRLWGIFVPTIVDEVNRKERILNKPLRKEGKIEPLKTKKQQKQLAANSAINFNKLPRHPRIEKRLCLGISVTWKEISESFGVPMDMPKTSKKKLIAFLKEHGRKLLLAYIDKD